MRQPDLPNIRRELARLAEPSGAEERTAAYLTLRLAEFEPSVLVTGLGGHGIAAVFEGKAPGATVLLRADMDGLPALGGPPGTHVHRCGHDGHMAMLLGAAAGFAAEPPAYGRVVLLFQPAEETGTGARAVMADPGFAALACDHVAAIHNLPGQALGEVVVHEGTAAVASRGLEIELEGSPSHAGEPGAGRSPVAALADLARDLPGLPATLVGTRSSLLTVVGLAAGDGSFGTNPGRGTLRATLRADDDETLDRLAAACMAAVEEAARAGDLRAHETWHEVFPATVNDPAAASAVADAAAGAGFVVRRPQQPFSWSEDFGHFTGAAPGVLVGLGAGEGQSPLHARDYEFPDDLLPLGVRLWTAITAGLAASK